MNDTNKKFVIKTKMKESLLSSRVVPMTALHAALEKISYDILELCGVSVPKSYLVFGDKGRDDIIGIATRKVEGINLLEELNKSESGCSDPFREIQRIFRTRSYKGKPIINFYSYLASFLFILDLDAIGSAFGNLIFKETDDGTAWEVVKIDPGEADLDGDWDSIFEGVADSPDITGFDYDLEHGYLLRYVGGNNAELTSRRFPIAFSGATAAEKLSGVQRITALSDKQLEYVIFNPCIPDTVLPLERRKAIIYRLIKRREFFRSFEQSLPDKPVNPFIGEEKLPGQHVVMRPLSDFEITDAQLLRGISTPYVFIKKPKDSFEKKSFRQFKAGISKACLRYIQWQEREKPKVSFWHHHGETGLKRAKLFQRIILDCTEINEVFRLLFVLLTRLEGFALWKHKGRLYEHSLDTYILRCLQQKYDTLTIIDRELKELFQRTASLETNKSRDIFREDLCRILTENGVVTASTPQDICRPIR